MADLNRPTAPEPPPERKRPAAHIDEFMARSKRDHRTTSLANLIAGCQREAFQGRDQECGCCYELFRRALQNGDEKAWEALESQYWGLVSSWCFEFLQRELPAEEIDLFTRSALIRFWQTLSTRTETLDNRFTHIGALLKYLQQCAATVIHDHNRELRRRARVRQACSLQSTGLDPRAFEDEMIEEMEQRSQIERIINWVNVYVDDDVERLVLRLSFQDGLTPRKIAANHENHFTSVAEVHQIKERVVRRLRRAMRDYG